VAALGKGASDFKPGDAVFGVCVVPAESAYAEKIALNQEIVARKPERFSHVECAAAGLAALTALISVEDTLQLKAGETVLIHGGAGGVAGFGIQLAKHLGARVISTASASNHDYVRGLGADVVIDYRAQDFTRAVSNCDAVFDTVGGDVTARSFAVLRPGGRLASIAGGAQAPASPRADVASHDAAAARIVRWRNGFSERRFQELDAQPQARPLTELQSGYVKAARALREAGLPSGHP